jgi:hypothetical protein
MAEKKSDNDEKPLYTETFYPPFFFPYTVTVTKDHISFGYYFGCFTKTIDRSVTSVVKAQSIDHVKGFREWGGWGIRYRRHDGHWETGYIAKNGTAVKLTLLQENSNNNNNNRDSNQSYYVFTCSDPKKVCDILVGK